MYVWRDIGDTYKYDDDTYTDTVDTTLLRYHTHACFPEKYDDDVSTIFLNPVRESGLSHFSALVCELAVKNGGVPGYYLESCAT